MGDTQQIISEMIRRKARQLVGKAGITICDAEDIEQDLQVDLLERMPKYDSSKADLCRFVKKLIRNRISKLLRERLAKKRGNGHSIMSLNEMLGASEGNDVELSETISDPRDPDGRIAERQAIVSEVIEHLPPELRELCELLKTLSVSEAAAILKTDRANLYRRIRCLREIFSDEGLGRMSSETADTFPSRNG